jgi:hypothetical protein
MIISNKPYDTLYTSEREKKKKKESSEPQKASVLVAPDLLPIHCYKFDA